MSEKIELEVIESEDGEHYIKLSDFYKCLGEREKTLQKENAKLRECVEFYASDYSWHERIIDSGEYTMIIHTDVIKGYFAETNHVGGKKARETLKELRSNDEPLGSELEGGE